MDILDKAKELGTMIANSPEMEKLARAEEMMESDQKAKTLLNDYKLLQIETVKATKENREKSVIDSIKDRLLAKQEEINKYEVTLNFIEAKNNFDALMKTINDVIVHSITGEEPCSSDKCKSCGGGCK
ncbi:MAG TPA: YlbF family regulator [Clostridia bacterium]|nr:YlbF family regulator [Clostridia bacterium]